jgi:hypothetical protein
MRVRTILTVLFFLLLPTALLSLLIWDRPDFLISSDTLLPAEFTWDVLHHGYAWHNFQQARVPSFIPDLFVDGVVQAVTGSWKVAIAVWVFVVLTWLAAIGSWITARIAHATNDAAIVAVMLVLTFVLIAAASGLPRFTISDSRGDLFSYLYLLLPFTHGGTFVLALTMAAIASRALGQEAAVGERDAGGARLGMCKTFGLALVSFGGGVSDLLWFTTFLVPLALTVLAGAAVGTVTRRAGIRLLSVVWGTGVLGWVCAQTLDREPLPFSVLYTLPKHIAQFFSELAHHPGMMIVVAVFGLTAAADVWRRGWRGWLGSFWSVFGVTSALGSLAMTMTLYEGLPLYRYASPFLWWTVILAASELARVCNRRPVMLGLPLAALTLGVALAWLRNGVHEPKLLGWQSPVASCLEAAGLRAGLADYWSARPINAGSNWQLQVEQISESGAVRVWGNDRAWYTHDIHDGARRPPYRFIVMTGLPEDRIAAAYGRPDRVLECDATAVWVYDDSNRIYNDLVRASPAAAKMFAGAPAD